MVKVDVQQNLWACATVLTAGGSESWSLTNLEQSALKCKTAMKRKALERQGLTAEELTAPWLSSLL